MSFSQPRVLIIGGGIAGVSAAYHLCKLGVQDIMLLERAALSSGTTWHSTGNMETYRADPLIFNMVSYAATLYPQIALDCRRDIGWRRVGRVMYTDHEDRWQQMRTLPELGSARGIEIESLCPAEVERRLPIISPHELLGGVWIPSDARVNPTDAVTALAQMSKSAGVKIKERSRVLGIDTRGGSVSGVVLESGTVPCDLIVLAAGLWSAELARSAGLSLPLHALEHQYLITKPCGVDRQLPLFLSFDDQLYGREEVGGLIVGSLDDHAVPISADTLPTEFASCLLNERWEQFEPYMAKALRRFPMLATAPINMLVNGPESFTPDGQMLLGPIPGMTGLWACCGFNSNGMALAPAAAKYLAEWIVEGAPSVDVAALEISRFGAVCAADPFIRQRVTEIPAFHSRLHAPDADYETSREVLCSPLHEALRADGAVYASVNGWERALWFAREDERGLGGHAGAHSACFDAIARDVRTASQHTLIIDRSTDAKHLLVGPRARQWLNERIASGWHRTTSPDEAQFTPLPGAKGKLELLACAFQYPADRCLLTTAPEHAGRLAEWLRKNVPAHLCAVEQTAAQACITLHGPTRQALLAELCRASSVPLTTHEDPIHDCTIAFFNSGAAQHLWRLLGEIGHTLPFRVGGHFADEAMRIIRGVPQFGREVGPATRIDELGPASVDAGCPGLVLVAFTNDSLAFGLGARDVLLDRGDVVGELTSSVRLPDWKHGLSLGRVEAARWNGQVLEMVADGRRSRLTPRRSAWDVAMERREQ